MSNFETPNNMGPLYTSTYDFYSHYIPPLNPYVWTDTIPLQVTYMTHKSLMAANQRKINYEIVYLSDPSPSFKEILEVCEIHDPKMMIVRSMPLDTYRSSENSVRSKYQLRTLVSRTSLNFSFISVHFREIQHMYAYSLSNSGDGRFDKLLTLSITHTEDIGLVNKIVAPELRHVDVYSCGQVGTLSIPDTAKLETIRIDSKLKIDVTTPYKDLTTFQMYGAASADFSVFDFLEARPKIRDLILAVNALTAPQIEKLNKDLVLGVYVTDANLELYINKFARLLVLGLHNRHQKAVVRDKLYCNFNIYSRQDVWGGLYKAKKWKSVTVRKEIIKTSTSEFTWPGYPTFFRERVITQWDKTVLIKGTCTNIDTIATLVENIKTVVPDLSNVNIEIVGGCLNENSLRLVLSHLNIDTITYKQIPQIIY